jgi:hypothetical protein
MSGDLIDAAAAKPPHLPCNWFLSARGGQGCMGIDRAVTGSTGAPKAADGDDRLSAFRRSNDELTFRDFPIGKAAFCEHGHAGTARDAVKDIAKFIKQTQ